MKLNLNRSFHYSWLFLPNREVYDGVEFFYEIGSTGGFFSDDLQCIVQLVRNNEKCTITISNDGGILEPLYGCYDISTPSLNLFKKYFTYSLPEKIREKFPLLNLALKNESEISGFHFSYFSEYGASFSFNRWKPIKKSGLYEHQMEFILKLVDYVLKVEEEFREFQNSRIYNELVKLHQRHDTDNLSATMVIVKLLCVGLKIYGGASDGSNNNISNEDFSIDGLDMSLDEVNLKMDDPNVIDYLLTPYNVESDLSNPDDLSTIYPDNNENIQNNNSDEVTFTGNNDKYSDNNYNRKEADRAFEEEARLRMKGDLLGAEAAHKRGMNHLVRIKDK